jgi:histidine triad (HIT) family protein
MSSDCIFCRIINREIPAGVVIDRDDVLVINDHRPQAALHFLVMPKTHVSDIVQAHQQGLFASLMDTVCHLSKTVPGMDQFRLVSNTGSVAGQTVFHAHMHVLAGPDIPPF